MQACLLTLNILLTDLDDKPIFFPENSVLTFHANGLIRQCA